jgi:hypothetical protein
LIEPKGTDEGGYLFWLREVNVMTRIRKVKLLQVFQLPGPRLKLTLAFERDCGNVQLAKLEANIHFRFIIQFPVGDKQRVEIHPGELGRRKAGGQLTAISLQTTSPGSTAVSCQSPDSSWDSRFSAAFQLACDKTIAANIRGGGRSFFSFASVLCHSNGADA